MGLGGAQRVVDSMLDIDMHEAHALSRSTNCVNRPKKYSVTDKTYIINLKCVLDVCNLVKNKDLDYIHCHMPMAKIVGLFAVVVCPGDTKVIFHEHGSIHRQWSIYEMFIRVSDRWVDEHISVSEKGKDLLTEVGVEDEKISVIRNFADLPRYEDSELRKFRPTSNPNAEKCCFNVGFAGRITERKGWRDFVRCTEYVSGAEFLIAGHGKESGVLKKRIESKEEIHYLGYIDDIRQLLSRIDCLVIPSHWDPNPLIFYEGLASETPVVASRCECLKEITRDGRNCLEFEPGNSEEMADKIHKFRENDRFRQKIVDEGTRFAERNSKSKFLDKFRDLYADSKQ
jgi:Glycosyltransferase